MSKYLPGTVLPESVRTAMREDDDIIKATFPPSVLLQPEQPIILDIMIAIYAAVFCLCLSVAIYTLFNTVKRHKKWAIKSIILCCLPWPILIRLVDMAIHINSPYFSQRVDKQRVLSIFFGGACGYFFFSTYLLLCLLWVFLYYRANERPYAVMSGLKWVYIGINAAVYTIWFTLIALMAASDQKLVEHLWHPMESIYATLLQFSAGACFFIFGSRLYLTLRKSTISAASLYVAAKIFTLTVICTLAFCTRSLLISILQFATLSPLAAMIISVISQLSCEILPTIIIIVALLHSGPYAKEVYQQYVN